MPAQSGQGFARIVDRKAHLTVFFSCHASDMRQLTFFVNCVFVCTGRYLCPCVNRREKMSVESLAIMSDTSFFILTLKISP